MKPKNHYLTFLAVLIVSYFMIAPSAFCDAEKKDVAKDVAKKDEKDNKIVVSKTTTGTVSYIDARYISVVYQTDEKEGVEYEIGFHLNEGVKLERFKDIGQINRGDTVELTYDEVQEEYEAKSNDGTSKTEMRILERKPRVITFVRPAKPELSS